MFVFSRFELNVDAAELYKNGERLSIRPKCFDVLVYLIEHRGRVIAKEELLEKLWPDVVVNEATLNRTVTELRAVLGDDAEHPKYIETVQRRGYKFIAEVTGAEREPPKSVTDFTLVYGDREFPLADGEHLLGRGGDVAVPVFASATSRHHARIIVKADAVTIEDLGSRNGTYVNGERITEPTELKTGDEIRIGGDSLVLWSRSGQTGSLHSPPPKAR